MSRTVLVLGAGASFAAGGPLMADFLDVAEGIHQRKESQPYESSFALVFKGLTALQAAHAKASLQDTNLETAFGAFEMARLLGKLGNLSADEVAALPAAMRRVIAHTLEQRLIFPVNGEHVMPPRPYESLTPTLAQMVRRESGSVSLMTFNYDLALDYALHFSTIPIDYGLAASQTSRAAVDLLKVHGSLNWARCGCGAIVPWHLADYFRSRRWIDLQDTVRLKVSGSLAELKHCEQPMGEEPVLVPPTWNKAEYHRELELVWRRAADHLAGAENIFVYGYSLPDTDEFFRFLFALGSIGETRLKRFWVYNPAADRKAAFEGLLGGPTRGRFSFFTQAFGTAIKEIPTELIF